MGTYPQHEFEMVGTWENEVSFGVVDAALPGGDVGGPSSGESDVEGCERGTVRPGADPLGGADATPDGPTARAMLVAGAVPSTRSPLSFPSVPPYPRAYVPLYVCLYVVLYALLYVAPVRMWCRMRRRMRRRMWSCMRMCM